jgi:cyclophilin family peptidyl-prolyl cis-trans isomerase
MLRKPLLLSLACFPLAVMGAFAPQPDKSDVHEETVKAVGLGTDDAALIDFFRSKTPTDADRDRIAALIRDLGADEFRVREMASSELVKIGDAAISLLRQAKDSRDLEIARRAELCLGKIEPRRQPAVTIAAARLLAVRRPAATAPTLLKFAPFADDPDVSDSICDTLTAVAVRDGKPEPVLTEALNSKQPLERGLAAEALIRAGQADTVPAVRALLDDTDRLVRRRVGLAFVEQKDKTVIPGLIELLADLSNDQSGAIVDLLEQIALGKSPQVPAGDDKATREKRRDTWAEWWAKNGAGVDLAKVHRKLVVVMATSQGNINIELFSAKAPLTVRNFLQYVEERHYDGLIFHRVIADFMIQGGGMEAGMKERKTRAAIKNEAFNSLSNKRGSIAMARAADPNSGAAQFFINVKDNVFLDKANSPDQAGYCVFGQVIGGMDVVDRIRNVRTGAVLGHENVPVVDVVIKSVRVVK